MSEKQPQDLSDLLDELDQCAKRAGGKVSVEEVHEAIGARSFGPLLLVTGLLGMTPVSAVPGAPTVLALITILVAGQLLLGRKSFWLPRPILKLAVAPEKVRKTVKVSRKPARFVDRLLRPRLTMFTGGVADRLVALVCVAVALVVPPLELLPLAAFIPALATATFGLGLVARDGLLILIALALSASALGLIAWRLLA